MSRNISYKDLQVGTKVLIKNHPNWKTIKGRHYASNKSTLILWFENDVWEYARNVVEIMSKKEENLDMFTTNQEKAQQISTNKKYICDGSKEVKLFEFYKNLWWGAINIGGDVWVSTTWDEHGENSESKYNLVEKGTFSIQTYSQQKITKEVEYFNSTLIVPIDTKYIATNKSGWVYAYPIKLEVDSETCFGVVDETKRIYEIGTCVAYIKNYTGDWKTSLVKV